MLSTRKGTALVGVDVEAGSVAAAQVTTNGVSELSGSGVVALPAGVVREGEVADPDALAEALRELFASHDLATTVRLGVANQKLAMRTIQLPLIEDPDELATAVRFQAQDEIPMPLEQAVIDFQVVGHAEGEDGQSRIEVVVVAARRDMISALLEAAGSAGLRPVGIDLSAFGMIRALASTLESSPALSSDPEPTGSEPAPAPTGGSLDSIAPANRAAAAGSHADGADAEPEPVGAAPWDDYSEEPEGDGPGAAETVPESGADAAPATLYCNLGDVTNLAIARRNVCLFTRISQFGIDGIAQRLAERRGLTLEHARQWLGHVGLVRALGTIEGDPETIGAAREALAEGTSKLADELRLSLAGYASQEGAAAVDGVVACGGGTAIPGLVERLQHELGQPVRSVRPAALSRLDESAAARLTLSYGLALEE